MLEIHTDRIIMDLEGLPHPGYKITKIIAKCEDQLPLKYIQCGTSCWKSSTKESLGISYGKWTEELMKQPDFRRYMALVGLVPYSKIVDQAKIVVIQGLLYSHFFKQTFFIRADDTIPEDVFNFLIRHIELCAKTLKDMYLDSIKACRGGIWNGVSNFKF